MSRREAVNSGLDKMKQAEEDIAKMKIDLAAKEIVLVEASKVSAELLKEITASTAKAEKKRNEVSAFKDKLQTQADIIKKDKDGIERDLLAAKPALDEAESALSSIQQKDIQGLKALMSPTYFIKLVFDGVLLLRQRTLEKWQLGPPQKEIPTCVDSYSGYAIPMMGDTKFLTELMEFNKDAITDETCELLAPYMDLPDFIVEAARKASGMAAGLMQWVRAMVTYHWISKEVIPKMDALAKAEAMVSAANKKLAAAQAELDEVQRELDLMQEKFDEAMADKQRLQDEASLTKRRMDSANALIHGLAGEKDRWTTQSKDFADKIARLVGDSAMSCAFMSYLGPFNKEFREKLLIEYFEADLKSKKVPVTKNLNVIKMLATDGEIGEWNIQGLPTDDLSTQNGILALRAARWPSCCGR
jgi:dynein heavy chain